MIFRAPTALRDALYAHAAEQGVPVSEVARLALQNHLGASPIQWTTTGVRFQPVTEITDATSGTKHRVRRAKTPDVCPHRVPSGSYCRRCNSGDGK